MERMSKFERITKKAIGCFEYDLKDFQHVTGEFATYDAFFDYHMAVRRLGEYEDSGLSPEEVAKLAKARGESHE